MKIWDLKNKGPSRLLLNDQNARRISEAEKYLNRLAYKKGDLVISLRNSIKIQQYKIDKSDRFPGRFLKLLTIEDEHERIEIDGKRLIALLAFVGIEPMLELEPLSKYEVEFSELVALVEKLESQS